MHTTYNLQRFTSAQDLVYQEVVSELKAGEKDGHWMWYIFPQIQGLGQSQMAERFAITSLAEAKAYLENPILESRLRQCTQLVLDIKGSEINQIFGRPDNLKFCSSMTLFLHATEDNKIFRDALMKYFEGKPDELTLDILSND